MGPPKPRPEVVARRPDPERTYREKGTLRVWEVMASGVAGHYMAWTELGKFWSGTAEEFWEMIDGPKLEPVVRQPRLGTR